MFDLLEIYAYIFIECKESKGCAPVKHHFDECVERVTGASHDGPADKKHPNEDCVEECEFVLEIVNPCIVMLIMFKSFTLPIAQANAPHQRYGLLSSRARYFDSKANQYKWYRRELRLVENRFVQTTHQRCFCTTAWEILCACSIGKSIDFTLLFCDLKYAVSLSAVLRSVRGAESNNSDFHAKKPHGVLSWVLKISTNPNVAARRSRCFWSGCWHRSWIRCSPRHCTTPLSPDLNAFNDSRSSLFT